MTAGAQWSYQGSTVKQRKVIAEGLSGKLRRIPCRSLDGEFAECLARKACLMPHAAAQCRYLSGRQG